MTQNEKKLVGIFFFCIVVTLTALNVIFCIEKQNEKASLENRYNIALLNSKKMMALHDELQEKLRMYEAIHTENNGDLEKKIADVYTTAETIKLIGAKLGISEIRLSAVKDSKGGAVDVSFASTPEIFAAFVEHIDKTEYFLKIDTCSGRKTNNGNSIEIRMSIRYENTI